MIEKDITQKWRIGYICFLLVLLVLMVFELNLIATMLSVVTFLFTLSSALFDYNRESLKPDGMTKQDGEKIKLLGFYSLYSFICIFFSVGKGLFTKLLIGYILLFQIIYFLHDWHEYVTINRSRKRDKPKAPQKRVMKRVKTSENQ